MNRLLIALLLILIPLQLSLLYFKDTPESSGTVAGISTGQSDVGVSAFIGDHRFTLFGYTSPLALVTFEGMGIFDQATADSKGYFQFNNHFSPLSPREACLSSKDQFGRISSPVCLSSFPIKYDVSIGPVLIPPTLSLNQEYYYTNDQVTLSGQTIPNSDIDLSVFTKNQSNLLSEVVRPVEAFTFPGLTARSDSKGNFSLSLPSSNPKTFRLFAQTKFDNSMSPTSINLNFKVMPIWMIIIQFFTFLLSLLKGRWLEITIIGEILIILYFVLPLIFHHKNLAIMLRKDDLPAVPERHSIEILNSKLQITNKS
jgi:hypothetical protein